MGASSAVMVEESMQATGGASAFSLAVDVDSDGILANRHEAEESHSSSV